MKKNDANTSINVIVQNPPSSKQAEERIKELSEYLAKIWQNPSDKKP